MVNHEQNLADSCTGGGTAAAPARGKAGGRGAGEAGKLDIHTSLNIAAVRYGTSILNSVTKSVAWLLGLRLVV